MSGGRRVPQVFRRSRRSCRILRPRCSADDGGAGWRAGATRGYGRRRGGAPDALHGAHRGDIPHHAPPGRQAGRHSAERRTAPHPHLVPRGARPHRGDGRAADGGARGVLEAQAGACGSGRHKKGRAEATLGLPAACLPPHRARVRTAVGAIVLAGWWGRQETQSRCRSVFQHSVSAAAFCGRRGSLLAAVGCDTQHTLSVWRWRSEGGQHLGTWGGPTTPLSPCFCPRRFAVGASEAECGCPHNVPMDVMDVGLSRGGCAQARPCWRK